jgi:hypothetical protein
MAYEGLMIPRPNLAELFQPSDPMSSRNAVMQGVQDGQTLAAMHRQNRLRNALRELVQQHDITTPEGKRALVQALSQSGLGEEALGLHQEIGGSNQTLNTPQGYQNYNPAYNTASPVPNGLLGNAPPPSAGQAGGAPGGIPPPSPAGGLMGGAMQSPESAKGISEQELNLGFNLWHDHIAKPFAEARGYKFSKGDINRLRMTLPKELEGAKITSDFFRTLKPEPPPPPKPKTGNHSEFDSTGIARNLSDIDSEIAQTESDLQAAQNQGAGPDQGKKSFDLRKHLGRLKEERRRYQSRAPAARGARTSKGKLTDPNTAKRYLEQAGNDPNKARELAKKDGWEL